MKKRLLTVVTLLLIVVAGAYSQAGPGGRGQRGGTNPPAPNAPNPPQPGGPGQPPQQQPPDPLAGVQQALNLTAAQVESLKTLVAQHNQALQPALETFRARQNEVQNFQNRPGQDGNRMANAVVASRAAEDQLKTIQDKYRADINNLLTPAQRQIVADTQAAVKRIGPLTAMGLVDGPMPGPGGMRGPNGQPPNGMRQGMRRGGMDRGGMRGGPDGPPPQDGQRRGPNGPPRGGGNN